MERRAFVGALIASALAGCDPSASKSGSAHMAYRAPERIKLIPDMFDIRHVGVLDDGRRFWVDAQLDFAGGKTTDFMCTFIFNADGRLVSNTIERLGIRGSYPQGNAEEALTRHLAALGHTTVTEIWVRLFQVESKGVVFGLIPRQAEDCGWRVDFMPGNTLSFYPPWDAGGFDT